MNSAYTPSALDKERLEHFAQRFAIRFTHLPGERIQLTVPGPTGAQTVDLPRERAYLRLLVELCSIASHWLCFTQTEHCAVTLLGQSDARLERLAQLHDAWVAEGKPEQAVTQLPAARKSRPWHR